MGGLFARHERKRNGAAVVGSLLLVGGLVLVGCTGANSSARFDDDAMDGPGNAMGEDTEGAQGGAVMQPAASGGAQHTMASDTEGVHGGAVMKVPVADAAADAMDRGAFMGMPASDAAVDAVDAVDAADAVDGGALMEVPATDEQLMAFRTALNRWTAIHSGIPNDVAAMVASIELVIVGVLGPPGPGRKLYSSPGSFDSYANLQVREVEVLKGALEDPSQYVHPEVPWPNDFAPDELVDTAPVGARVIILGERVREALEEAQRLEEEGISAVDTVKPNLIGLPPYGLLLESVTGETHAPLWELGSQGPLVQTDADRLAVFEDALTAIRTAAGR